MSLLRSHFVNPFDSNLKCARNCPKSKRTLPSAFHFVYHLSPPTTTTGRKQTGRQGGKGKHGITCFRLSAEKPKKPNVYLFAFWAKNLKKSAVSWLTNGRCYVKKRWVYNALPHEKDENKWSCGQQKRRKHILTPICASFQIGEIWSFR